MRTRAANWDIFIVTFTEVDDHGHLCAGDRHGAVTNTGAAQIIIELLYQNDETSMNGVKLIIVYLHHPIIYTGTLHRN